MATDQTAICNLALYRMGQSTVDDAITGTSALEVKCAALYSQARDELETEGPELGWKFCRRRYNGIDREEFTIASIAQSTTDTDDITVTGTHTLGVGDMVTLDDTEYDDDYVVNVISTTASFDVTADFDATDTGTAYWTSEQYAYRYLIPTTPTVLRVASVQVGGIEVPDWIQEGGYILTNMESSEVDMIIVQQITTTTKFPPHFTKALYLKLAVELTYNITQDLKSAQIIFQDYMLALDKAIAMDERGKYNQESSQSWQQVGNTMEIE